MRNFNLFTRWLCLSTLAFLWCCQEVDLINKKDEPLSGYSGTWNGQTRLVKIGDCFIYEGWYLIEWDILVEDDGTVTFTEERFFDSNSSTWIPLGSSWTGQIMGDNSLSLTKSYAITCNGVPTDGSATLTGAISKDETSCTITLEGTEVWCPTMNCVFKRYYEMELPL